MKTVLYKLYRIIRLVGAGGGGATLNIIPLVIGITNCQIKYNLINYNTRITILKLIIFSYQFSS